MAGRFPILRQANEPRSFAIGRTGLDSDTQMPKITPGNLIFEKFLLHWLTATKSRRFQNALSDTSGLSIISDLSGLSGTWRAISDQSLRRGCRSDPQAPQPEPLASRDPLGKGAHLHLERARAHRRRLSARKVAKGLMSLLALAASSAAI